MKEEKKYRKVLIKERKPTMPGRYFTFTLGGIGTSMFYGTEEQRKKLGYPSLDNREWSSKALTHWLEEV